MKTEELTGYPSIDKPWLKYYEGKELDVPLSQCTVYENIYHHNKDYLDQIALEYFSTKISYKKLFEQVEICAEAITANGITKGSIVNICSSGVPEIVYLVLACSKMGAVANFINPLLETRQKIDRINDTDSDTIFVLDKMYGYIKDVIPKTNVKKVVIVPAANTLPLAARIISGFKDRPDEDIQTSLKSSKFISWNAYVKSRRDTFCPDVLQFENDLPMIMVYSSGTTGASKGIVLTNDGINMTITQYEVGLFSKIKRGYKFLHNVPIWFSTGVSISLLMPLCLGVTCILEPVFSPENFLNDITKYKPNYALVATGLWLYVMEHLDDNFDLSFLFCPITGGEQMLDSTEMFINDFLKRHGCSTTIQNGWGMCELGATAATSVFLQQNRCGSVGIPMPFVTISAFDVDRGTEKKYGERGELRVQTPCRMKEYYKNQGATDEFFYTDADGNIWGCTGDIGYVDRDGFVFVLGRASDFFISPNGERYYLFDTENAILQNGAIDLCEVVTVNSEKLGREVLIAHIVLKKNFNRDLNKLIFELDRLCKEKLSEYAVPVYYKVRESFTISPSGKRDKLSLKNERDGFTAVFDGEVQQVNIE